MYNGVTCRAGGRHSPAGRPIGRWSGPFVSYDYEGCPMNMPDWLFYALLAALPVLGIVFFVVRKMGNKDD